jgi:coenzyme F420 hydrogenase subunit delta
MEASQRSDFFDNVEILPAFCKASRVVLGIGNVLFGDDGFGPAVIDRLTNHYHVPNDVYMMDVGTGARKLLFTLALSPHHPQEIIIVDAVDGGAGDGQVGEIRLEDLPSAKRDDFSLHQVPTSNLLQELQEIHHVKIMVIACDVGCVPQMIQPGLSSQAEDAVIEAAQLLAAQLDLVPKGDIQHISN